MRVKIIDGMSASMLEDAVNQQLLYYDEDEVVDIKFCMETDPAQSIGRNYAIIISKGDPW